MMLFLWFGLQSNAQINIQRIDSIVQKAVLNDHFEGTVLLAESGTIVYHKSFEFKDYQSYGFRWQSIVIVLITATAC